MIALLRAVDRRDGDWLAKQPEDARKEFAPLVAMRWATGVKDGITAAYALWLINRRVNRHLFDLEPDLAYRLLASCGIGTGSTPQWVAGPRRTAGENAALCLLAEHHPMASDAELRMLLSLYSRDDFALFLDDCGLAKDKTKECLKAYDKLG